MKKIVLGTILFFQILSVGYAQNQVKLNTDINTLLSQGYTILKITDGGSTDTFYYHLVGKNSLVICFVRHDGVSPNRCYTTK